MAKNSSKLAGKIFPDAFKRADEIKQLPLAQLDQSIKELVKLGECVEILSGFAFKSDLFNTEKNGMPLIRIRDVVPAKTETYYSGDYLDDYLINNDDLLIGMDGDFNREKWQGGKALLNQRVCKISAVPSILNQDYLYHFLPKALLKIHSETPAVTVKHLSVKTIKEIEIPIPPLAEQKRLAAILDKADAIRRKRQQAIELADKFLRSVFLDMFGDPVTNPKGWDEQELSEIALVQSGVTKGRKLEDKKTVSVPYMRVANVQDGYLNLDDIQEIEVLETDIEKYRLHKGDLLLTEGGDPDKLGRGSIWQEQIENCIHQNHIFCVRPNKDIVLPIFLSAQIGSSRGKRYFLQVGKQTTGIATINKTVLCKYPALMPPIELQREFAKRVEKVETLKAKLKASQLQAEEQFKALSQRAFAGEL